MEDATTPGLEGPQEIVVLLEFKGQDFLEGIETILRATGGEVALLK